jgi:hypothetical protein
MHDLKKGGETWTDAEAGLMRAKKISYKLIRKIMMRYVWAFNLSFHISYTSGFRLSLKIFWAVQLHIQIEEEIISDDDFIMSDEDEIDNSDDKLLLLSLQNGVLPPDIKFLYALSLLGEGISKSAALTMLSSVNDLDSESAMPRMNADFFPDKSWVLFQSTTKGKLKRPAALMMLLDLLRRSTNLEESCAEQVLHLFEKNPLISSLFLFEDDGTEGNIKTRAFFFAAISRLKLYSAISASESKTLTESIETILSIINEIERAHKDLWFEASSIDGPSHTTVLVRCVLRFSTCFPPETYDII